MNKGLALIGAAGVGAGLMYILDPDRGNRRRALVRDKVEHTVRKTKDEIERTSHDLGNRMRGLTAALKAPFKNEQVTDDVLVDRVKSKLGHVVATPGKIAVKAADGVVTLSGQILEDEVENLLGSVSSVRGVGGVDNKLRVQRTSNKQSTAENGRSHNGLTKAGPLVAGLVSGGLMLYYAARHSGNQGV